MTSKLYIHNPAHTYVFTDVRVFTTSIAATELLLIPWVRRVVLDDNLVIYGPVPRFILEPHD